MNDLKPKSRQVITLEDLIEMDMASITRATVRSPRRPKMMAEVQKLEQAQKPLPDIENQM